MRILSEKDISSILRNLSPQHAKTLLDSFATGLASYAEAKDKKDASIIQPQRTVIRNNDGNTVLCMPVSDTDTVVKVATVPLKGDIAGAITIYNAKGELQAVLNAAEITAFRTALAAMTILTLWPRPASPNLCIFGSGKQAEWHLRLALILVPDIKSVTVFNRGSKRLHSFDSTVLAALRSPHPSVEFRTVAQEGNNNYSRDLSDGLVKADMICCCTPSTEPLFTAQHLQANSKPRFLSLIGSYKPTMREIDTEVLNIARKSGTIWVDLKEACLEEAGELIDASLKSKDLTEVGELYSNTQAEKPALDGQRELTLFKCVGFGYMDLVISKALLAMAEEADQGLVIKQF